MVLVVKLLYESEKSSIAVKGREPEPELADFVQILIQTLEPILFNCEPKFTVTFVVPQEFNVVVMVAGDVVTFVKEVGEAPKP